MRSDLYKFIPYFIALKRVIWLFIKLQAGCFRMNMKNYISCWGNTIFHFHMHIYISSSFLCSFPFHFCPILNHMDQRSIKFNTFHLFSTIHYKYINVMAFNGYLLPLNIYSLLHVNYVNFIDANNGKEC